MTSQPSAAPSSPPTTEVVTGIAADYLHTAHAILDRVGQSQGAAIEAAAQTCAAAIADDHLVHVFGSGHSRMLIEETWPRYGSFPGFHPIVELSLTNYHQVSGSNGQRQAMFLENVPGLAEQIARNFRFDPADVLLAISSGGTSVVTVEMAEIAAAQGLTVVALTSVAHSRRAAARTPSGRKLFEVADIVIDTCTPVGDAAVRVPGLDEPVAPASTVAGAAIVNAVKARIAELLVAGGMTPRVLTSAVLVGEERSAAAFDAAYDEHARRVAGAHQPH
ncbi:sugar isomerase domain-containing protein [Desertimonas flava]|uniref:sugar isomerase domain-containing protein n=1 Tax=Desertimonas flava TaxID=2064846 RepID=UPI001968E3F2|nr:sugar isomerase domain-containing protein [Desertimonas flava]